MDIAGAGGNFFVGFLSWLVYSAYWVGWRVGLQFVLDPYAGNEAVVFAGNALRMGSGWRPVGGKIHFDQSGMAAGAVGGGDLPIRHAGLPTGKGSGSWGIFRA